MPDPAVILPAVYQQLLYSLQHLMTHPGRFLPAHQPLLYQLPAVLLLLPAELLRSLYSQMRTCEMDHHPQTEVIHIRLTPVLRTKELSLPMLFFFS